MEIVAGVFTMYEPELLQSGDQMSSPRSAESDTVVLVEKGGRFFVYQPALGVIAADDTVERAYDKFVGAKRAYLDDLAKAGLSLSPAVSAPSQAPPRHIAGELAFFLAKTCIVFVLIGAFVLIAADQAGRAVNRLASGIDQAIAPLKSISLLDLADKAADIAKDAQNLPPEKKDALRRNLAIISREAAPFFEAWRNPPQAQPTTQPPADDRK